MLNLLPKTMRRLCAMEHQGTRVTSCGNTLQEPQGTKAVV